MVRSLDLKSGDPEFKSPSDHKLDLSQVVPGSTPRLHLYIANWSASCQLGFLNRFRSFIGQFHLLNFWPTVKTTGNYQQLCQPLEDLFISL